MGGILVVAVATAGMLPYLVALYFPPHPPPRVCDAIHVLLVALLASGPGPGHPRHMGCRGSPVIAAAQPVRTRQDMAVPNNSPAVDRYARGWHALWPSGAAGAAASSLHAYARNPAPASASRHRPGPPLSHAPTGPRWRPAAVGAVPATQSCTCVSRCGGVPWR